MRLIQSKALEIYDSLDVEQKEFVKTKILNKNYKPKKFIELFNNLGKMDLFCDQISDKITSQLIGWGAGSFFSIFISVALADLIHPLFLGLMIIPFSFLFYYIISYFKHKNINIHNSFRLFLIPLVSIFKEEIPEDNKIYLQLNLNPIDDKKNLFNKIPKKNSNYPYFEFYFYKSNWMNMEMTLFDSSLVNISITDVLKKKETTKTNGRGKVKTKTKTKSTHRITVRVSFDKKRYKIETNSKFFTETNDTIEFKLLKKFKSSNGIPNPNMVLSILAQSYKGITTKG
jgi:hypothetical protein